MQENKGFFLGSLIGVGVCCVASYLALLLDWNLVMSSVLFIIPVGGIIFGMILGTCAKRGVIYDNQVYSTRHKVTLGIFALLTPAIATFIDYATCFVDYSDEINRVFNGMHVSEAYDIGFLDYFFIVYFDGALTFSSRGGSDIEINSVGLAVAIYVLQYVGAALTAIIYLSAVKDMPMCPSCGKYYKSKEVDRFFEDKTPDQIAAEVGTALSREGVYTAHNKKSGRAVYLVNVKYCKDCRSGFIEIVKRTRAGRSYSTEQIATYNIGASELYKFQLVQ